MNVTVMDEQRADLGGNLRQGDVNTFCPRIWSYFIQRYAIRSMLDVGCGEGHAVSFFARNGVLSHGIDGLRKNVERAVIPIALHDILAGSYFMPVDFVWSCEVAEHIAIEKVDNYLDTLANGRVVAITHAVPGQDGYHHVNCQAAEYWIDNMKKRNYTLDKSTDQYRKVSNQDEFPNYFAKTGLVFTRN